MYIKRITLTIACLLLVLTGCGQEVTKSATEDKVKIGIMLSDVGLGDQSFSDLAFNGLVRARDELGIVFDYRELADTGTYEKGIKELIAQENDIIIGLGFMVQEDLEKVAKEYPDQRFVLIDAKSRLDNVTSVNFKADQASYLAGIVAASSTKTNKIGFIGGEDAPVINAFADGFRDGAKSIHPDIDIEVTYANNFGDDKLGQEIAKGMIEKDVDVLFAAAGFTGVGALKEAQLEGVYAIGVDTDQYFYAEKAVITSVMKNIDIAIYQLAESLVNEGSIAQGNIELGIDNNGVGLAPLRVHNFTDEIDHLLDTAREELANRN